MSANQNELNITQNEFSKDPFMNLAKKTHEGIGFFDTLRPLRESLLYLSPQIRFLSCSWILNLSAGVSLKNSSSLAFCSSSNEVFLTMAADFLPRIGWIPFLLQIYSLMEKRRVVSRDKACLVSTKGGTKIFPTSKTQWADPFFPSWPDRRGSLPPLAQT